MKIVIRDIKVEDYSKVSQLIQKTHRISLGEIYPNILVEDLCKKYELSNLAKKAAEIDYWIAEDEDSGKILGIIGLKDNELRTFFVDPDFQGKGVGKSLYNHIEQIARNKGIRKITLVGSPLGQPIYKKLGFVKLKDIHKERVGIPYTDAIMEKVLT